MKYLNKSFSVYMGKRTEEGCSKCHQACAVAYVVSGSTLCPECYGRAKKIPTGKWWDKLISKLFLE